MPVVLVLFLEPLKSPLFQRPITPCTGPRQSLPGCLVAREWTLQDSFRLTSRKRVLSAASQLQGGLRDRKSFNEKLTHFSENKFSTPGDVVLGTPVRNPAVNGAL